MDVNTNYNTNYSTNYNVVFQGGQYSSTEKPKKTTDIAIPGSKTPHQQLQAEIHEKVLMDLKDVQNFLYMLIGSNLRVEEDKASVGKSLNVSA